MELRERSIQKGKGFFMDYSLGLTTYNNFLRNADGRPTNSQVQPMPTWQSRRL